MQEVTARFKAKFNPDNTSHWLTIASGPEELIGRQFNVTAKFTSRDLSSATVKVQADFSNPQDVHVEGNGRNDPGFTSKRIDAENVKFVGKATRCQTVDI
jgi:hypothetical protein